MTRRIHMEHRCARCRLHMTLCLCSLLPRLVTRTKVILIIHRAEDRKSSNTGRLATECLPNSEVVLRGALGAPNTALSIAPDTEPLLLFPSEDAIPIETAARALQHPATLIVPDGNWRQASRVRNRIPGLRNIACVSLPNAAPSKYRLRDTTHAGGLATIEAIAQALGVLEGPEVQRELEFVFHAAVERALWARGAMDQEAVTGGIPNGATRHAPRG